jgi:hypothetical protein
MTKQKHDSKRQVTTATVLEGKNRLQNLADYLRAEGRRFDDAHGRALFETSAEVLLGLKKAFMHYAAGEEEAWKSPPIAAASTVGSESGHDTEIEDEYNTHEASFRRHYQLNYSEAKPTFEFYEPAYEFGYKVARDNPGKDWTVTSIEAQTSWQESYTASWKDVADAVYYGWREQRKPESLRVQH